MLTLFSNRSHTRLLLISFVAVITLFLTILFPRSYNPVRVLKAEGWFTQNTLATTYHLFDLGVTDINNDNLLDIFTVNHSVRQKLLINEGHNNFQDQLLNLGLEQSLNFPGVGPSDLKPNMKSPGLYIYWYKSKLVIQAHKLNQYGEIKGEIQLPESVVIKTYGNGNILTKQENEKLIASFSIHNNDQLIIESRAFFFTPIFELEKQIPLNQVYLGSQPVQPDSYNFTVNPGKDRHGMAWADFNGDNHNDVFIIRGGGGGRMSPDPINDNDELLLQEQLTFEDRTFEAGILKEVCPGRQVSLVDFDGDDQLDIYTGCGRGKPPRELYPNQLHRQFASGQFANVSDERGIDIQESNTFTWLDADQDQDMDL